ncbi:SRPBCC family protein [Pseudarthrobacter sp. AL07]|uniref:SRPBCC family protein n=1 Tax=unclassified Pseudarthrobacter TaxID=2647000 RepID=UPI00249AF416|nr:MULTISPECIES: SRPBCC family protein [unclassified Pseudarthrobacter]MDI3194721.1 SRPBCC family protein [Pseudarthrobacter sp. AL20]MDI3208835.1 SRPBCC family protein [Pseudarthrobacter sp. AL07]
MAFAEHEVLIRCDAMSVYTFLVDGMNLPQWRRGIRSISLVSGAAGTKGAVYRQTTTGRSGRTISADFEITQARPGAEIQFQVVSVPSQHSGGYYLSTEPAGTRVRFALEYQPKGLLGLMNAGIQRTIKAEVSQLARLKDVLEVRSAA